MRFFLRKNRIWIAAGLLLALLLAGCGETAPPTAATATPAPEETPAPTPEPTELPVYPASNPDLEGKSAQAPGPESTPPPVTPPPVEETPLPAVTERVDDTYFADAAFLGNSLMDGLRLFGKMQYGDFYSGTSASVISVTSVRDTPGPVGKITKLEALLSKQYGKIYVLFGINELGFNVDSFTELYAELLGQIAAGEPNAKIIVLSLTPITRARDAEDDLFTRERVQQFNEAVAEMATSRGYTYLNLYDALADENGWLPEQQATDGIHFQPNKYLEWAEFLRTHFDTEGETDVSLD